MKFLIGEKLQRPGNGLVCDTLLICTREGHSNCIRQKTNCFATVTVYSKHAFTYMAKTDSSYKPRGGSHVIFLILKPHAFIMLHKPILPVKSNVIYITTDSCLSLKLNP